MNIVFFAITQVNLSIAMTNDLCAQAIFGAKQACESDDGMACGNVSALCVNGWDS